MTDRVRCPACRGAKKVPKLGGIVGECNTCSGVGTILESDKPKPVIAVNEDVSAKELISAVSDCVPTSNNDDKFVVEVLKPIEIEKKVDGKKAIYKRKKA